jgi:hypothetical protein
MATNPNVLSADDVLDLPVPGFKLPLAELFD